MAASSYYFSDNTLIKHVSFDVLCDSFRISFFPVPNDLKDYKDSFIKVIFRVDKKTPVEMEWMIINTSGILTTRQKEFFHEKIKNANKLILTVGSEPKRDINFPITRYKKA